MPQPARYDNAPVSARWWTFQPVSVTQRALGGGQFPYRNWPFPRAFDPDSQRGNHVQVLVRDNNVDQALKALKKKMQREGIFREMKLRGHYEKPSERRAREKAEAIRRARKLARKRAQREGLIPMKPKLVPTRGGGPGGGMGMGMGGGGRGRR
jgi:small subunit ribosomal protein S21